MTKEKQAQKYLIVRDIRGKRHIVNIRRLLRRHSTNEIIQFLNDLYKEQEKQLQELISKDKTNHQIDTVVSKMFRLHMAMSLLKESPEVTKPFFPRGECPGDRRAA